jgi:hypothetical protein
MSVRQFKDQPLASRFNRKCPYCQGFIGYNKTAKTKYCSSQCVKAANACNRKEA